eukprot:scaffold315894_cov34-Prasinocladus_malaysianus.AAC.1
MERRFLAIDCPVLILFGMGAIRARYRKTVTTQQPAMKKQSLKPTISAGILSCEAVIRIFTGCSAQYNIAYVKETKLVA